MEAESCHEELRERDKIAPEVQPETKKAKEEEPRASGVILSFFNRLFASVNL